MCYEDYLIVGSNPDIWWRTGAYTVGAGPFWYTGGPARVTYMPNPGSNDYNPELWNSPNSRGYK